MTLDKGIKSGKERRKEYRGSESVDRSCRPHGGGRARPCPWCEGNRTVKLRRLEEKAKDRDE